MCNQVTPSYLFYRRQQHLSHGDSAPRSAAKTVHGAAKKYYNERIRGVSGS